MVQENHAVNDGALWIRGRHVEYMWFMKNLSKLGWFDFLFEFYLMESLQTTHW